MRLTSPQQEAILEVNRPLQIIACAGSGKTQVISQRISHLLGLPGVTPANIVAFTFTEKAAGELGERIRGIVAHEHPGITGMADLYVGTMHAYCLQLLQTWVPEAFKFNVLTDITQRLLIDRASAKSGLTTCPLLDGGALSRYKDSRLYQQVLSVLQEDDVDFRLVPVEVRHSLDAYLKLIADRRYFDYTTLMATAVGLLTDDSGDAESRPLRQHVFDNLKYLVVDEYQDVNPLQQRLIDALVSHGANLCVVGDDDQTIYQWRGSDVSNILTFADRHPGTRTITMDDNFRSSRSVVALGRSIAETIPAGHRLPKGMTPHSHQSWVRGDLLALSFDTAQDEARWTVNRIQKLRGMPFRDDPDAEPRGLSWSDCAILYRTVKDAEPVVDELRRRGIPYVVKGLARLFDAPEITAVVGVFKYMVGELDPAQLRELWEQADLLPEPARFGALIRLLDDTRRFDAGERWGAYNIQRLYLGVLETLRLRESTIPGDPARAELVMYQLGKFSQVISDFETIHFSSAPDEKYKTFASFLHYQAPSYYAEADEDAGYLTPDAVTISTVHGAKGMQWPAVFTPCMRKNRFPMRRQGGRNLFHVIPLEAVQNGERYRGTLEEETRLFYVAVTRAKKYCSITFSPGPNQQTKKPSQFFTLATGNQWVSTHDEGLPAQTRLEPTPRTDRPNVTITFSELKYLFDCPYQFKLRFMYGFNPPIHEALGYGRGLHDALAEMHKRAIDGDVPTRDEAEALVDRHLNTPYAYPALREQLHKSAVQSIQRYFDRHGAELSRTIHSEKRIRVEITPGTIVEGRIDLIRRLDTSETSIVDFKSTERAQAEDVTRDQLHVYAIGYQDLTGENADLVEVLNLDEHGRSSRESVDDQLLNDMRAKVSRAADDIRHNRFICTHDHSGEAENDLAWLCSSAERVTSEKREE